jgi:hypothetical protein
VTDVTAAVERLRGAAEYVERDPDYTLDGSPVCVQAVVSPADIRTVLDHLTTLTEERDALKAAVQKAFVRLSTGSVGETCEDYASDAQDILSAVLGDPL